MADLVKTGGASSITGPHPHKWKPLFRDPTFAGRFPCRGGPRPVSQSRPMSPETTPSASGSVSPRKRPRMLAKPQPEDQLPDDSAKGGPVVSVRAHGASTDSDPDAGLRQSPRPPCVPSEVASPWDFHPDSRSQSNSHFADEGDAKMNFLTFGKTSSCSSRNSRKTKPGSSQERGAPEDASLAEADASSSVKSTRLPSERPAAPAAALGEAEAHQLPDVGARQPAETSSSSASPAHLRPLAITMSSREDGGQTPSHDSPPSSARRPGPEVEGAAKGAGRASVNSLVVPSPSSRPARENEGPGRPPSRQSMHSGFTDVSEVV